MKHAIKRLALLLAILTCLSAMAMSFVGCGGDKDPGETDTSTESSTESTGNETDPSTDTDPAETTPGGNETKINHTIRVESAGGLPLDKVTVAVYADEARSDLKGFGTTASDGSAVISLPAGSKYYAVLSALPAGYNPEASYLVSGTDTTIKVASSVISDTSLSGVTYKLGDIVRDFEFVDTEGKTYKLSEVLKEKKMVMLNFWATWCGPCESEFPDMSEAYNAYKDTVEIIALDPDADDTAEDIANYKASHFDFEIPFPMFKGGSDLFNAFACQGYPTSIIIDRYGMVTFMYSGPLPSESAIKTLFNYYSAENYEQKIVTDISELVEKEKPNVSMPSSEELGAAFGMTDAVYAPETDSEDAEYSWPFVITKKDGETCVVPSNTDVQSSYATLYITMNLKKGDAVAFDYLASSEAGADVLYTLVKRNDINADSYKDMYSISGVDTAWNTCYTYVATADGEYTLSLCFIKDSSGSAGDDTVYLKNLRVVKESDIDVPSYIFRYAVSNLKEDHSGYTDYAAVFYNETDGYYHVGTKDGPLLLANLMSATRFSQTSIYSFALDGQIVVDGVDYLNDLIPYASYASNSAIYAFCPVNQELKDLLVITANALGLETDNPDQWLQICSYYDAYGTNGVQLADPTRGLYCTDADNVAIIDPDRAFVAQLGENIVTYDRMIIPRGLLYKFTPAESGAYRIESKCEYLVEGWIFTEDGKEYYVFEGGERLYNDENNVSMIVYMEAGQNYYIDICYYDVYGTGDIAFDIEYLGKSYQQFTIASPGFFTYPDGEEANGALGELAEILAGGIDVVLGSDGYWHEKLADGSEGSILYADFEYTTPIFDSESIQTLISKGAFDFTKTADDEYILALKQKYGDNLKTFLQSTDKESIEAGAWGDQYDELAAIYKLDEVLAGKMHGTGTDLTDEISTYIEKIIKSTENPEQDGCVAVDERLAEILQMLMDKYTFSGVDHSWTKLCYYYRQIG